MLVALLMLKLVSLLEVEENSDELVELENLRSKKRPRERKGLAAPFRPPPNGTSASLGSLLGAAENGEETAADLLLIGGIIIILLECYFI